MEARHLALLRDLRALGTLAEVARITHRTPSALSQQLRTAERELGARLVEPQARGLRLTPAGEALADGADEVEQALARVRARLEATRNAPGGTVSITTLPSAGEVLLPGVLADLRDTEIRVLVDDIDVAEADFAGRAAEHDLVIAHRLLDGAPPGAEHLRLRTLAHEPLDIAMPPTHDLAARERVTPEDLRGATLIGVPEGYPFDTVLLAVEQTLGAPLRRSMRIRDNRLVAALVAVGVGLALLPRFSTPDSEDVVLRPLHGVNATRRIIMLARPDRLERAAVARVVEALVREGEALMAAASPDTTSP